MSKEKIKGLLPEHLERLEKFKKIIKDVIAKEVTEVEFGVMDDLDLSDRLRITYGGDYYEVEDKVLSDAMLKMAQNLEAKSAIKIDVSVYMWSDDTDKLDEATRRVVKHALRYKAELSKDEDDQPIRVEDLHLTPLEEVMTDSYKRINRKTGRLYKHFHELVFVFSKRGNRKNVS